MKNPDSLNFSVTEGASSDDASMFELAPVSLWLEDYSGLKTLFEEWRSAGVTDLRAYLNGDLDRVKLCANRLKVVKVNAKTLTLFEVANVEGLGREPRLRILRDDMLSSPSRRNSRELFGKERPSFSATASITRCLVAASIFN